MLYGSIKNCADDTSARCKGRTVWKQGRIFEENDLFFIIKQIKKP